ncbi:MAG: hypothetical protein LBI02_09785 [Opitutaceae bacterium]|nr:hypothetical protein [Opitutaceae bacterium]
MIFIRKGYNAAESRSATESRSVAESRSTGDSPVASPSQVAAMPTPRQRLGAPASCRLWRHEAPPHGRDTRAALKQLIFIPLPNEIPTLGQGFNTLSQ